MGEQLALTHGVDKGKTPVSVENAQGGEPAHPQEDSPLLHGDTSRERKFLSFYHYLHPIVLSVLVAVIIVSSILSAFETVCLSNVRPKSHLIDC